MPEKMILCDLSGCKPLQFRSEKKRPDGGYTFPKITEFLKKYLYLSVLSLTTRCGKGTTGRESLQSNTFYYEKIRTFLCLSLLFAFTGCSDSDDVEEQGGTVLAKPSVAVTTTTSSSFKVAWDAVPNAESYKYRLSQENETGDELVVQPENSTSATALAFGDLDPKTKYILRVKAVAAAGSGLTDSEYSKSSPRRWPKRPRS